MLVVVALNVVDQAFIQRPGIELTFPVVNNRVAEAENLGLLIGHAGLQPGFLGSSQGFFAGVGNQRVSRFIKRLRGGQRIFKNRQSHIGVVRNNGFWSNRSGSAGSLCRRLGGGCSRCAFSSGCSSLRGFGFVAVRAGGQQKRGGNCQRKRLQRKTRSHIKLPVGVKGLINDSD